MAYDRFMIAPYSEGMITALEPWMIPDQAFALMWNSYVWRGRVRKRFGGRLMGSGALNTLTAPLLSRFRILVDTTSALPIVTATGNVPGHIFKQGQQFSIGDVIFTVTHTVGTAQMLRTDGSAEVATFDIATGAYNIRIDAYPLTPVFFYPSEPVMGLTTYNKGAINNHPAYGFDTQFVYRYNGSWERQGVVEGVQFHGDDTDFFWTCNYNGPVDNQTALFITNFNATVGVPGIDDDSMWTYDVDRVPQWDTFAPRFTVAGDHIVSCRLIVAFKDRLLLLNTIEQNAAATINTHYPNRCRYSWNGSPLSPTHNAFLQVNEVGFGGGGYIDAATEEAIVSAEFIKDRLIVYFERSTWELAYTGNQVLPFVWQKINTELGADSTFSVVPFDREILGVGNTGIHACNGSNVERIDVKIPEQIFQISNKSEGVARVAGIRDYTVEMVYWTFPSASQDTTYPDRVLVYNYKSQSWSYNDDCITAFGYFEQQTGLTWQQILTQWQVNNSSWTSGTLAANFRQVIAGNQEGYVFIVDPDVAQNAPVMSLTHIVVFGTQLQLTIINHTLQAYTDFIYINDAQGTTGINGKIFRVNFVIDEHNILINPPTTYTLNYTGGGNVTRVSRIKILTKQFNPYVDKGRNVYVSKIDFNVLATANGEITVDYAPSTSELSMIEEGETTGSLLGTSVLETHPYPSVPMEAEQTKLWHPVYFQTEGEFIQFALFLSDLQMIHVPTALSDFWLEGMILHTMPTSSRLE